MALSTLLAPYVQTMLTTMREVVPALSVHPTFYGQIHYHLGWADAHYRPADTPSGKRIRPAFCLMSCEVFAGKYTHARYAAVAVELLHEFSLVHDDIEDGDRTRRHRPTLWTIVGTPQAINAGDALFAWAQLALLKSTEQGIPAETVLHAQRRLNETALALCEGQHLDMDFERRARVTPDEYVDMSRGKTAALLGFAGEVGALFGGASLEESRKVYDLGEAMGLAFQMRDDLLGIWGDTEVTGKPVGADIRAKKKSLPVTYALSQPDTEELRRLYQGKFEEEASIVRARDLITATGARDYTADLAAGYESRALALLETLDAPPKRVKPLYQLANELAKRTH